MSENDQVPASGLSPDPAGGKPPSQLEAEELAAQEEPRDIRQPDIPADQLRAPEAASARKYAEDGVVGAPGSETPGGGRPPGEMTPVPSGIKGDEPTADDPRYTAAHAADPEVGAATDAEKAAEPELNPPGSPSPGTPAVGGPHEAPAETQVPDESPGAVDGGSAPAESASHQEWIDYAVSRGAARDEAHSLSKAELVKRYGSSGK